MLMYLLIRYEWWFLHSHISDTMAIKGDKATKEALFELRSLSCFAFFFRRRTTYY